MCEDEAQRRILSVLQVSEATRVLAAASVRSPVRLALRRGGVQRVVTLVLSTRASDGCRLAPRPPFSEPTCMAPPPSYRSPYRTPYRSLNLGVLRAYLHGMRLLCV